MIPSNIRKIFAALRQIKGTRKDIGKLKEIMAQHYGAPSRRYPSAAFKTASKNTKKNKDPFFARPPRSKRPESRFVKLNAFKARFPNLKKDSAAQANQGS